MPKNFYRTLVGLSLLFCMLIIFPYFAQAAGSISGTVINDWTGQAVPSVKVEAYTTNWELAGSGTTDASGYYAITGLSAGQYKLHTAYDSTTWWDTFYGVFGRTTMPTRALASSVIVVDGADTGYRNITLYGPSHGTGAISGRVTRDSDGAGIPGVLVIAYRLSDSSGSTYSDWAYTDASGNYLIAGLAASSFYLKTYNNFGYVDEYYNNAYSHNRATLTYFASDINFSLSTSKSVLGDFDGNGKPDILWRNTSTGDNAVWYMDGVRWLNSEWLPVVTDQAWEIVGIGDFNSDHKTDILWRNTSTGDNAVWYLDGVRWLNSEWLPAVTDQAWKIVGTEDFNNDGKTDILWRNTSTGDNAVWYLDGIRWLNSEWLPAVTDQSWAIVGTEDFNNDGKTDILWRNTSTGDNAVWCLYGVRWLYSVGLPSVTDQSWAIASTGDFNNDTKPDILWRNTSTGDNAVWYLDRVRWLNSEWFPAVTDQSWKIVGR